MANSRKRRESGMEYIRRMYGVPAKRGMEVRFGLTRDRAKIVGSDYGARLRVKFWKRDAEDWSRRTVAIHPTWKVEYPEIDN